MLENCADLRTEQLVVDELFPVLAKIAHQEFRIVFHGDCGVDEIDEADADLIVSDIIGAAELFFREQKELYKRICIELSKKSKRTIDDFPNNS